jgi:hypothetical protein
MLNNYFFENQWPVFIKMYLAPICDHRLRTPKNFEKKIILPVKYKYLRMLIPRWWLEGGSRKRASYSEILERHRRHTLQA